MTPPNDPLRTLPLRYRVLLALLPGHVRDEHGRELRDDLSDGRQATATVALDILKAAPGAHWDVLRQDLTLAFRQIRRSPTFALVAGLTLAIGIGGNVAFFTLVDGVLLRQLPIAGADRIVDITEEKLSQGMRTFGIAPANFRDLTRDSSLFQAAAAYTSRSGTAHIGETRDRVSYAAVSGQFFRVFTDAPLTGRTLQPDDDVPGASSIVLSYDFWQRALGGDPDVLSREIEVDGTKLRVVGVMPESFTFPRPATAFWRPIGFAQAEWDTRGARFVSAVARLRPGVPVARAASALEGTGRTLAAQYPKTNDKWSVLTRELRDAWVSRVRTPLMFVWGAGALVLLIAVANVASLFLSRAVAREREVALRAALGARTGRVVRQLVTEGLVLTSMSAAAGIAIAYLILARVRPLAMAFVPRMSEVMIGTTAVQYTVVLVMLTTLLLSVVATSSVRRRSVWTALGSARASASRQRRRLQHAIVVVEVALAVFVLVGSTLVVRTLVNLLSQPMGFDARNLLTFRVEPPWRVNLNAAAESIGPALYSERRRAVASYATLLDRLRVLPGATGAGAVNRLPLTGDWWTTGVRLPDRGTGDDAERLPAYVRPVTPGYLEAMKTRIVRGRGLSVSDVVGGERVVVIDAELARQAWGNADPLGREVMLDGPPQGPQPRARVVGVVETIHMNQLDADVRSTMYVPFSQALEGHYMDWGMDVVVRGVTPRLEAEVRRVVRAVFPDAVVFRVATMESLVALSTADRRFQLLVLAFFGTLALLLATIGVGGTLLLSVRERRRELAVYMALGARPDQVWWRVQRDGIILAGGGALLGVAAAIAGARVFSSLVYGVSVRDPLALVAGPVLVIIAAFVAAAIPATRAVQVSPVAVLRE